MTSLARTSMIRTRAVRAMSKGFAHGCRKPCRGCQYMRQAARVKLASTTVSISRGCIGYRMAIFVGLFVGLCKTATVWMNSMLKLNPYKSVCYLARPARFERATTWFVARCTIQCLRGLRAILSQKRSHFYTDLTATYTAFCGTFFAPNNWRNNYV